MIAKTTKVNRVFIFILLLAILFKLSIFIFGSTKVPGSIFDSDSNSYLVTAEMIYTQGIFAAKDANGKLAYESFRTPGYPIFLAVFHHALKLPLIWIVFIQLILVVLAGVLVYKTAVVIDSRLGLLAMAIVLFDPPTSVYSLKILTEALFLFMLALFFYVFTRYIKSTKTIPLLFSSLLLALTTYVRPVSYYLALFIAVFILYVGIPRNYKKAILHTVMFLAVAFSIVGIWQLRNYLRTGDRSFATVIDSNMRNHSLITEVEREKDETLFSKGLDYLGTGSSSFVNLMTLPGSLKYFNSKPFAILGKVIFYAWMGFWMIGFLIGCVTGRRNVYFQFLLWVMVYFIAVTVINISEAAGERFRIPMVPCIAIIASYGWLVIKDYWLNLKNDKKHTCCT